MKEEYEVSNPKTMILGTGHAVPDKILSNADLEKMVDTSGRWIQERTGILERRVVEPGTPLSELAVLAGRRALEDAGVDPADVDLIIVGTVTGDMKFPATACFVQAALGASNAAAFDVSAACSGFIYGLQIADALMQNASYRRALVIGGDILTSMVDWEDRDTCILFGDGAGAAVLGPAKEGRGILSTSLRSDGSLAHLLYNPGCGSLNPPTEENVRKKIHTIRMEGREVFRHAVKNMTEILRQVLRQSDLEITDLDMLIPHQANLRIIEAVSKKFGLGSDKVYINVERFGNTSAASIPIALDEASKSGRLGAGDHVGVVAFGAGFAWAAGIIRL